MGLLHQVKFDRSQRAVVLGGPVSWQVTLGAGALFIVPTFAAQSSNDADGLLSARSDVSFTDALALTDNGFDALRNPRFPMGWHTVPLAL